MNLDEQVRNQLSPFLFEMGPMFKEDTFNVGFIYLPDSVGGDDWSCIGDELGV